MLLLHCLHRDPVVFPNANEFNPERFDARLSRKLGAYEYMPFAAGQRNCLGNNNDIKTNTVKIS